MCYHLVDSLFALLQRFIQEDGNVTVDVNVFDGLVPGKEVSINEKLATLLEAADDDWTFITPDLESTCKAVLDEFHVPCTKTSCTSRNDQSYQLTIDQVCAAIDSPIKLLTSAVAEHVDGINRLRGPFINGAAHDYVADIDMDKFGMLPDTTPAYMCCSTPDPDGSCDSANSDNTHRCQRAIDVYSNLVDTARTSLEEMETEWKDAVDKTGSGYNAGQCDSISFGMYHCLKNVHSHACTLCTTNMFLTMLYKSNKRYVLEICQLL